MKKIYPNTPIETISVLIKGRVQGVGFRAAAVRHAHMLRVSGWIRNLDDGSVEALLQGPHDLVDRMLSWLNTGPPGARVSDVSHVTELTERYFDRFEQQ